MKRIVLLMAVLLLIPVTSWAVPIVDVSFVPLVSEVDAGGTITVNIVADISAPVLGWGLDISFDSGILSLTSISIGSLWKPASGADKDGLAGLAFPTPVSGQDIVLATLTFTVLDMGVSNLVASITAGDKTEGFALTTPGQFAQVNFTGGQVKVTPEPSTIILFMTGLAGLVIYNRQKRKMTVK